MKIRNLICGIIWAIWIAVMFYFLEQPGEQSAAVSGMVTQFILRIMNSLKVDPSQLEYIIRKLAHFSVFIGSGFLGVLTIRPAKCAVWVSLLIHAAFAVISEYLQTLAPDRFCSPIDMGIDFAGSCIGILFACVLFAFLGLFKRRARK